MAEAQPEVPVGFSWRQSAAGRVLVSTALDAVADHFFSSRDVSAAGETMPDYQAIGDVLGVDDTRVVRVRQVHGRAVVVVRPEVGEVATLAGEADVVVSTDTRCAVSVRVADCVPILIADGRGRAVAAVHAGWRGTASGAARAAVEALEREGIEARTLIAAIGPSIGPCCYQVDLAVKEAFANAGAEVEGGFLPDGVNHFRLDLWRANRAQLESCGVPASQIVTAALCTAHDLATWYSHRRQGAAAGRMVAAIRLRARP